MKRFGILALALTFLTGAATVSSAQDTTTKKEKKRRRRRPTPPRRSNSDILGRSSWPAHFYLVLTPPDFVVDSCQAFRFPPQFFCNGVVCASSEGVARPLWLKYCPGFAPARPRMPGRPKLRRSSQERCPAGEETGGGGDRPLPLRGCAKRLATTPGWRQFTVTPVPARRRANSRVKRTLASLDFRRLYSCSERFWIGDRRSRGCAAMDFGGGVDDAGGGDASRRGSKCSGRGRNRRGRLVARLAVPGRRRRSRRSATSRRRSSIRTSTRGPGSRASLADGSVSARAREAGDVRGGAPTPG